MTIVSGGDQSATVTLSLPQPVVVRVTVGGTVSVGATVAFQVARGGGTVDPASATTDQQGLARTAWTMGRQSGQGELTISATVAGVASAGVSARATAMPARGALLTLVDGSRQQAVVRSAVPVPPRVIARDSGGAPLAGVGVTFTVATGGGFVQGGNTVTDNRGEARIERWTLGAEEGEQSLRVVAEGAWVSPPLTIAATAVATGGMTLYPQRSYAAVVGAGGGVVDSVTGARFVFPAGGNGVLSVARIAEGRPLEYGSGTTAVVEWSGAEPVRLAMARNGEEPNVLAWGVPRYSMEGGGDAQWMALPRLRETDDSVTFDFTASMLRPPATAGLFGQVAPTPNKMTIMVARLSVQLASLKAREKEARDGLVKWRQALPVQYWPQWDALVTAYPLNFAYAFPSIRTGECPTQSRYVSRIRDGSPTIEFCTNAVVGRGWHEVGHYVTDLLPRFRAIDPNPILDRAPGELDKKREHNWGSSWWPTRYTITEDYAFFSEYLNSGRAGGYVVDGTAADFFVSGIGQQPNTSLRQHPKDVDYPTLEGFGIALLAAVTRTSTVGYNFDVDQVIDPPVKVPAMGLSRALLIDVLARGPVSIEPLVTAIELEMLNRSEPAATRELLPVVLEGIGWSYHRTIRVVQGAPGGPAVAGITVSVGYKGANTDAWLLPPVGPTSGTGVVELPRIFPHVPYFLRLYFTNTSGKPDSVDLAQPAVELKNLTHVALLGIDVPFGTPAEVTSVSPKPAYHGETVTVRGGGFGTTKGSLRLGNIIMDPADITFWSDTEIRFLTHPSGPTGTLQLTVRTAAGLVSNPVTAIIVTPLEVQRIIGPTSVPSADGSQSLTFQVFVRGSEGPYAVRWYSLNLNPNLDPSASVITTTYAKLGMEVGDALSLRWIYLTVADAHGRLATWQRSDGRRETEFAYGVGLVTTDTTRATCAVRGLPAPQPQPPKPPCVHLMP